MLSRVTCWWYQPIGDAARGPLPQTAHPCRMHPHMTSCTVRGPVKVQKLHQDAVLEFSRNFVNSREHTCPPLSPSPQVNRFITGTAVINNNPENAQEEVMSVVLYP
jgi:hypothetical protein